jgi:replicative DNA helicase
MVKKLSEVLGPSMENISESCKHEGIIGITSGLPSLDSKTAGFQNGDLIIIAARPSMGKTALAITCALNAWQVQKKKSMIFSLEMSGEQLTQRFLAIQSGVNLHNIRGGTLSNTDFKRLSLSCGPLSEAPIYIDDSFNVTVSEIRSKTRRLLAKGEVDQVFIDYLGLMQSEGREEKRYREIGIITRGLKGIAKDFNLPVIALSQLSRAEKERGKRERRPILSDLRESGDIEQDADLVIFIYREYEYTGKEEIKNDAELIVAKQRNGPLGKVNSKFEFENAHFVEPDPEEPDMFDDAEFKAKTHKQATETWQDKL